VLNGTCPCPLLLALPSFVLLFVVVVVVVVVVVAAIIMY
jgi:hypothetical protein